MNPPKPEPTPAIPELLFHSDPQSEEFMKAMNEAEQQEPQEKPYQIFRQ